jgi:hypothetical protein
MKRLLMMICASFAMTAGVAMAQQFTARPRVAPEPEQRPPVEENSTSSWYKKFVAAPNKLQLISSRLGNMAAASRSWWRTRQIQRRGRTLSVCSRSHFDLRRRTAGAIGVGNRAAARCDLLSDVP